MKLVSRETDCPCFPGTKDFNLTNYHTSGYKKQAICLANRKKTL